MMQMYEQDNQIIPRQEIDGQEESLKSSEDLDKKNKNESIQLGILIKAYGQLGRLDLAFSTFYDHNKSDQ